MTCAYRVRNLCFQHTKPQLDSLWASACDDVVWDYPLGATEDCTLHRGGFRLEPVPTSQSASMEGVMED
jgi:hypothetical protein